MAERPRPLSPFMHYRWLYTNTLSILHRITGVLLAAAFLLFVYWLVALANGPDAYAAADGSLLWQFDTNREFVTVNGVTANGGSMDGPGPSVAGGLLFVNSGYGGIAGRPGNVLLVFGVE